MGLRFQAQAVANTEGSPPGGRHSCTPAYPAHLHTSFWPEKEQFQEVAGPGPLSPETGDVKAFTSVIGLAKMARTLLEVSWWNMIWGLRLESWWATPSQPSVGAVMDHQWQPGPVLLQLLHLLWLLPQSWTAPQGWRDDLLNHTFQHTMYCQKWSPSMGLSETYDNDQLFSFDFSQNTRVPRLPEFADWAQKSEDNSTIFFDKAFCQAMIHEIGPKLEGRIPECRGIPVAEVFTLKPLEFGKPNTLVCFVSNLFPPALTVTWQHHLAPVEGAGPTFVSAIDGLSFQAFSYLNFTPAPSDLFSCVVTHEIDGQTAVAYWVPNNALPSDLLENVLCGVAFGLGVLGIIVGLVLIIYFRKPCSD